MRWAGHVAHIGERRDIYRVLAGKPKGKRPLGRPRHSLEDNIKMDLQKVGCGGIDWIELAQDRDRWWAHITNNKLQLKESVGNIHKRLCAVYGSCAVDRSTVGRWVQRVKASGSGETEIRAVRTWIREQETSWYREGTHALVSRWRKAVDVDGDYVEK
jgi:hypothetical protein